MKRIVPLAASIAGLLGFAVPGHAAPSNEFSKITGQFVEQALKAGDLDPDLRAQLDTLGGQRHLEAGALTASLRGIHPDFAEALKVAADDPSAGLAALEKLTAAEDQFLAAESSYYLSRMLIGEERFEEALPHLKKLRTEFAGQTLRSGESLYYQGLCNANMLQRTEAADNLNDFVENHPDASPRLLGAAWDLIVSLERVHRGSVDDVATHMEFSRRKLGLTDPGDTTQEVQTHIITMLDELIERAEEQEKQQPP